MYEDRSLTDHHMFIELISVISDDDGAPIKEGKVMVNISLIKSIVPSEDMNIKGDDDAKRWKIWNKTFVNLVGGGCLWVKQPYQEIKQRLEKALNMRF